MKIKGLTGCDGGKERTNPAARKGPKGAIAVVRGVKSGDVRCPNRPAAAPYLGHRLSLRGQMTAMARGTLGERPTPPTECRPPVRHSPPRLSVDSTLTIGEIGWPTTAAYPLTRPAPAGENAGGGPPSPPREGYELSPWTDDQITRLSDAAAPHFPASVIGGFDARDEANSVARDKRLDPSPVPPRLVKTPAAVHPLPSERAMNFRFGLMKRSPDLPINRSPDAAGPHSLISAIGSAR